MNILNKLTIKHLTMNKKRTIVTIIGIILSTALMVGIGTIASTFVGYMIEDAKSYSGSHHVKISDIDNSKVKYIKNNTDISEYALYHGVGYAILDGCQNEYKPYLYIISGDNNYLSTSKLIEGRLPKNENEIVISSHIISNGKVELEIGDTLTLNIGKRYYEGEELTQGNSYKEDETFVSEYEKEYTIVGIATRRNDEFYSAPGYTVVTHTDELNKGKSTALITYKKVKNIEEKTLKIASSLNLEKTENNIGRVFYSSIDYNDSLLTYYGESSYDSFNNMFTGVIAIVLTLIMTGCAIVIYNSFAISVMERKKQFGLFSSIGATKKQLRKTVFFEALIVSLIGIPLGILSGIFGIWVVVEIVNILFPTMSPKIELILIPTYIILPVIYMVLTIIISAFIPAKRASMISPIEAIRLNDDIKINKNKIKTKGITKKIFGIEAELALKNMKRNKKKYRITILSLVVSIVLFLSFSAFLEYGLKSTNNFYNVSNYDILIEFRDGEKDVTEEYQSIMSKLREIDSIKDINTNYYIGTFSNDIDYGIPIKEILHQNHLSKDYYKYYGVDDKVTEKALFSNFSFSILPDDEYKEYIKELGLNPNKYNGEEINLIYPNSEQYFDYENGKVYEFNWYDESYKEIEFIFRSYEYRDIDTSNDRYKDNKVTLPITYVDNHPKLMNRDGNFIVSYTMYKKIENYFPIVEYDGNSYEKFMPIIYMSTDNATKTEQEIKNALDIKDYETSTDRNFYIYNARSVEESERNTILFIGILLYGFITLVTLIGVTSVFNTINTSIALRRKEFAVLRSIGLTPKGFNKMIRFESLLYGIKALMIGIPISFVVMCLIKLAFNNVVSFGMFVPVKQLVICILGVFIITFITMTYATRRIKRENILDAIREENI